MSRATHLTAREWDLGDGLRVTVMVPCEVHGAIRMSRDNIEALREYIALLEREAEIAERVRRPSGKDGAK